MIIIVKATDLPPETCTAPSALKWAQVALQAKLRLLGIRQMLLDLIDRKFGKVLVDLGDDFLFHVGVKRLAQIGKRSRRRHHDQSFDPALAHDPLQHGRDLSGEAVLLEFMPVGLGDAGSPRADRGKCAARTIRPLLMGRRICVGEHALGLQIEDLRIAFIAQNQRLGPIADEDKRVVRSDPIPC